MRIKSRDRDPLLGEQQCREDSRHREHSTFRAGDTPGSMLVSTKRRTASHLSCFARLFIRTDSRKMSHL